MLAPGLKGLFRHPFDKRNFALHLDIGTFQFLVKIFGNVSYFPAFYFYADLSRHLFKLNRVFNGVVFYVPIDYFPEHVQHTHAVVGMGRSSGGHHSGKIASHNGINSSAAYANLSVRVFGVQSAWAH